MPRDPLSLTPTALTEFKSHLVPDNSTGCLLYTRHNGNHGATHNIMSTSFDVQRLAYARWVGDCRSHGVKSICKHPSCCRPDHLRATKGFPSTGILVPNVNKISVKRAINADQRSIKQIAADYNIEPDHVREIKRAMTTRPNVKQWDKNIERFTDRERERMGKPPLNRNNQQARA